MNQKDNKIIPVDPILGSVLSPHLGKGLDLL